MDMTTCKNLCKSRKDIIGSKQKAKFHYYFLKDNFPQNSFLIEVSTVFLFSYIFISNMYLLIKKNEIFFFWNLKYIKSDDISLKRFSYMKKF